MTEHAELGASSSARWMACPGSVPLSRPYEARQSVYAAEGHVAHALAEARLGGAPGPTAGEVVEADGHKVVITAEMEDAVEVYTGVVEAIRKGADRAGFEIKVSILSVPPGAECYGTTDFVAVKARTLHVVDFKYGKGVAVHVAGNSQALFYALAAWETLKPDIDEIEIVIVQPRIDGAAPKVWTIDLIDLLMWRDNELLPAVQRILDGDKSLHDGPWCRFCPALAACPLKHDLAQAAAKLAFIGDGAPANVEDVSPAELADRLKLGMRLADWFAALQDEATLLIRRGEDVPGFKLVEGRAHRKWADDDKAIIAALMKRGRFDARQAESFYAPPELQSPAQLEKTLKRMRLNPAPLLEGLINRPAGKPALVTIDDPRPAMRLMTVQEAFRQSVEEDV
jgi:hypothetical protein